MVNFKSLDLLIEQINFMDATKEIFSDFDGVKAFYSNPEIYTAYKYKEYLFDKKNKNDANDANSISDLDLKNDDFFPYSDCDHCFWTGYFTSRPALKRLERVGSSFLQAARQIQAMFNNGLGGTKAIELLEKGVAIAQHHDGVSGTSKQHVADDYAKKIQVGINEASAFISSVLASSAFGSDIDKVDIELCQLRNESLCEISQSETEFSGGGTFFLFLYNSLGHKRSEVVSVPVSTNSTYNVAQLDESNGNEWVQIEASLVPNFNYAKVEGAAPYNLLINTGEVGPVSFSLIKISIDDEIRKDKFEHLSTAKVARSLRHGVTDGKSPNNGENFILNQGGKQLHFSR